MTESLGQKSLVFEFDSIEQRRKWKELEQVTPVHDHAFKRDITEHFSGLLRVADMLTDEILVTDAQLLDGVMFLTHGPVAVRKLMARSPSELPGLVVLGRDRSLAECLRKMLLGKQASSGKLAMFESSTLAAWGEDASAIAEALKCRSNHNVKNCEAAELAKVVAAELQGASTGVPTVLEPTGVFAELAHYWQRWFEATDNMLFPIREWLNNGFDLAEAQADRDVPASIGRLQENNEEINSFVEDVKKTLGRSSVLAMLRQQSASLPDGVNEQLREWWNSTYFDAMARQHNCSWLRLTADCEEAAVQEDGGGSTGRTIQFKGEMLGILSAMPPSVYASARYTARVAKDRWREDNSQGNCNGVAFAISKFNEPIDRRQVQRSLIFHVGLVFAAALLGWFASEYWSGTAGWAAVVSIALVVLVATPVAEFIELHSMRSKKMKAFINIPGAING